jgi:hypothetical protein
MLKTASVEAFVESRLWLTGNCDSMQSSQSCSPQGVPSEE